MKRYCQAWIGFLAVGLWWGAAVGYGQPTPPNPNPPPPPVPGESQPALDASQADDVEVMTRGPVHEAYAGPVARGEGTPIVVTKAPPDAIEEIPPDTKPEGDNVVWISGYWAWDDDRKDYLWVSGVWRAVPANQTWVPGYWTEIDGGYRWVSGFWMPQQNEEVEYLAEPPATIDQGPTSPSPSDNYFWNPGYWTWYETRYVWRPGFWTVCQPDWIWVPAHYRWTPRGWVFIPGYWDYPLVRRGVLFAPICFRRPPLHWHAFRWCPAIVIQPPILGFHLFIRPNYGHYYFGDYYAVSYEGLGFRPWFHYHGHRGFDPLFNYYRWYNHHRMHDRDWERNIHGWFTYYRHNEHQRPPHTLLAQHQLIEKAKTRPDFQQLQIGKPIKDLAGRPDSFVKLAAISDDQRNKIRDASRQLGDFKKQRLELESLHRIKPGDAKLGLQPGLKPDTKIVGKPDLPERLGVTGKPEGKGIGKPSGALSGTTLKQPDKVRLPTKLDLGKLGAGPSHGPTLTAPGSGSSKPGVTVPGTGVTGPKMTLPDTKPGLTGPKMTLPDTKRGQITPKTGATGPSLTLPDTKPGPITPKSGMTIPKATLPDTKPGLITPKSGVTIPKTDSTTQPSGVRKSIVPPPSGSNVKPFQPGGSTPPPTIRRDPGRSSFVPKSADPPDTGGASGVRRSGTGSPPPTFRSSEPATTKQSFGSGASSGRSSRGSDRDRDDRDNRDQRR